MIDTTMVSLAGLALALVGVVIVLRRMSHLRGQLIVLSVAVAALPVAAVVAELGMLSFGQLATITAIALVAVVSAGILATVAAGRLSNQVDALRTASGRVAEGDLAVRVPEEGPEELRDLASSFNEMTHSLGRLSQTRRNLVGWATHDLRTPLSALQAMVEALEDGLAEPADYLPAMSLQVRALSRLVDDLFELSRIEMGTLALSLSPVPVAELASACVELLRPKAEAMGIDLRVAYADGAAVAPCAPEKVERVLGNLLSNALRHTPDDGSVAVRVSREDGAVLVAVEDTGAGIAPDDIERVFESFWRADAARTDPAGHDGLGLAIARGLVEAHGGRIWAENRTSGGARFCFTLPTG